MSILSISDTLCLYVCRVGVYVKKREMPSSLKSFEVYKNVVYRAIQVFRGEKSERDWRRWQGSGEW